VKKAEHERITSVWRKGDVNDETYLDIPSTTYFLTRALSKLHTLPEARRSETRPKRTLKALGRRERPKSGG
jgi:hypothetical protein